MSRLDELLDQVLGPAPTAQVEVPPGNSLFAPALGESDATESQSFAIPSGTQLDIRLGFRVGCVIVDNNTSSSLNIPDATKDGTGRFIPPGQGGAVPILGHISRARINWTAPPGKNQTPFVAGETAQVVFLASPVPPGFGVAAPSLQTQPWQFPLNNPQQINSTLAAGANATIIAGVAGQTVYLFEFYSMLDAASATPLGGIALQDTLPVTFCFVSAGAINDPPFHPSGFPLVAGRGVRVLNNSGASVTIRGGISYSQV